MVSFLIGSGIATGLLGVAYYAHIHHLYYFIIVQILGGMMQVGRKVSETDLIISYVSSLLDGQEW